MEFSQKDITVLISMTLAVVLITITFNGMGMADQSANVSDIEKYQLDQTSFDLVGEFPDNPGTPSSGTLTWDEQIGGDSNNHLWLNGDTSGGTEIFISNETDTTQFRINVTVNVWSNGNVTNKEKYELTQEGDRSAYEDSNYKIIFEQGRIDNKSQSDMVARVTYDIEEQESSGAEFLQRIPIIGGIYDGAEATASAVAWIGSILYWIIGTAFEIVVSVAAVVINAVGFVVGLFAWLTGSYYAIVDNATGFAKIFVLIPGMLLSIQYMKLAFVVTDVLWLG